MLEEYFVNSTAENYLFLFKPKSKFEKKLNETVGSFFHYVNAYKIQTDN